MDESGWTYQERYVRCGKASCSKCGMGDGHGPYWYGFRHERGRMYSKYFGKYHPQGEDGARRWRAYSSRGTPTPARQRASDPPQDRWARPGRMDYNSACRIFGVNGLPRGWKPEGTYRMLMGKWHPDHGGDNRAAVSINLAYAFIKAWLKA
jgi:hypothetical protein